MAPYIISGLVFIINIPFGYWRKSVKRFSFYWFLAIHIPVIISILLRFLWHIEFRWEYILLFVFMFFAGQLAGKQVYSFKKKTKKDKLD